MKFFRVQVAISMVLLAPIFTGCQDTTPQTNSDADITSDSDIHEDADMIGDTDDDGEGDPERANLPAEANESRLTGIVELLSDDKMQGRLTGTPSGDSAEAEVLAFLENTGIETATQDVAFDLFEVTTPAELTVISKDGETTFAYIDDFREVDFSGSGRVEGDLVFAGFGIEQGGYNSFEGLDLDGKIAVMLTSVPAGEGLVDEDDGRLDLKVNEAAQRGAVGVIFVPAREDADYDRQRWWESEFSAVDKYFEFHPEFFHADVPVAFIHVESVESILGVSYATLASDLTGRDLGLEARLEINGTVHEDAACRNVFGIMHGTDPEVGHEVIVLGAHYDHIGVGGDGRIFNGASDNASGTGIVLETAATLVELGIEPRRSIVFALFCGEEQGLWGSVEYAYYGTPPLPMADTVMMIQVDYIGESDGPYLTNVDSFSLITEFLGDETSAAELPIRPANWFGNCASDDCPFLYYGIPAYRFVAYGEYHHMAEDDFENLNITMVDRVADVCIRGLGRIAF